MFHLTLLLYYNSDMDECENKYDWTITQGDKAVLPLEIGLDLTGCTLFFTAKTQPDDVADDAGAAIKAQTDPADHEDAATGLTQITLLKADTTVDAGVYQYDVQVVDVDGEPQTVLKGTLTVESDITNRTS